jgi:hypothetical protein
MELFSFSFFGLSPIPIFNDTSGKGVERLDRLNLAEQ